MKKAFTIIEIIFVIIILGILASFVASKIYITREDAYNVKQIQNFKTLVNDINSYYTSNGELAITNNSIDLSKMTNVRGENIDTSYYVFKSVDGVDCFYFGVDNIPNQNSILTIVVGDKASKPCERMISSFLQNNINLNDVKLDLLSIGNKVLL